MNRWLIIALLIGSFSCAQKKTQDRFEIDLPFFNDPDLTPVWILPSDSAYQDIHTISSFELVNQDGDTISNEHFDGKLYVANFFFTICSSVCPKMTKNLHRVQENFGNNEQVKILSHTVMPWSDSVGRLKEYAQMNEIMSGHWHLATGSKEEIYSIARHSYFADQGSGKHVTDMNDFLHTEKLILIDQKRRIRGVYNGTLPLEVDRMIEDIGYLLRLDN